MNCVIVDDEPLAIRILEGYIEKIHFLDLKAKFTNPVEAFKYLNQNIIDLIFIDIQMPDLSGLELIGELEIKPLIIFTTAFPQYALEGFKADAIDYLLKPVDFPEFKKAVLKASDWFSFKKEKILHIDKNQEFLFIRSEYKLIRINFKEILYVQGMNEYVKFYTNQSKPILSLIRLKNVEDQLPDDIFMRVHKSFIVNLNRIRIVERNEIIIEDGTVIPVSTQFREKFQAFIDNNFMV